jgi:hypothetical protein
MALDTYDNLKISVIEQLHRGSSLNLKINDFILLAEAEMRSNRAAPLNMRLNEVVGTVTTIVDSDTVALPTDYQQSRSLRVQLGQSKYELTYRTPAALPQRSGSGTPCYYTFVGNSFKFDIATSEALTLTLDYLADFAALTSVNQTNDVLTKYPGIYLYGCLKHGFIFADDNEMAVKYDGLFIAAIDSANVAENLGRFGDSPTVAVRWAP